MAGRDSAGIRITEHTWAQIQALPTWTVDAVPSVQLGANLDASGAYAFSSVSGVARLQDGTIVVAENGSGELRAFSGAGDHKGNWGREGEGPGEFSGFWGMGRLPGDSIVVWDLGLLRLTVFDSLGNVSRMATLEAGSWGRHLVGALESGAFLFASIPTSDIGDLAREGYQRVTQLHVLGNREGAPIATLGPHQHRVRYGVRRGRSMWVSDIPFSPGVVAAVWGDMAVVARNERYEILTYGVEGSLKYIIRVDRPSRRISAQDVDAYWRHSDSRLRQPLSDTNRMLRDELPMEVFLPAFSAMIGDRAGHLWVKDVFVPGNEWQAWTVFDSAGRAVSRVQLPGGLEVLDVGQDYVLGTMTGEMGVESVTLFALFRSVG